MKLSMWILSDWLKSYQPDVRIQSGKQILSNVRLLSDSSVLEKNNVYIGNSQDFIPSCPEGVICVNNKDIILLKTNNIEDVFNDVLNAFDYFNEWRGSLHEKIDQNCSIKDIIDLSQNIFQYPILIVDSSHQLLAASSDDIYSDDDINKPFYKEVIHNHFLPIDMIEQLNQELEENLFTEEPYYFDSDLFHFNSLHKNIFYLNEHVGWIIMHEYQKAFTEGTKQLFDFFGKILSLWMVRNGCQTKLTPQSELFLQLLIKGDMDTDLLHTKMKYIDWYDTDEKYIIKIMTVSNNNRIYHSLKNRIEQTFSGCYVVIYESSIILIVNTKKASINNTLENIKQLLVLSNTYCGISYPFYNIKHIKQAYDQSGIALTLGEINPGNCNFCCDYVLSYAKSILQQNINIDISHNALQKLRDYDKKHNTDYYDTLNVYLQNERNQIKTAKIKNIHRNTLVYRVNRINELLQIDLDDLKTRNHIILSYFLE